MATLAPDLIRQQGGWSKTYEWYDVDLSAAQDSTYLDLLGPSLVTFGYVDEVEPGGTSRKFEVELVLDNADNGKVFKPAMAAMGRSFAFTYDFANDGGDGTVGLIVCAPTSIGPPGLPQPLDGNRIRWTWDEGTGSPSGSLHALRMTITPIAAGR